MTEDLAMILLIKLSPWNSKSSFSFLNEVRDPRNLKYLVDKVQSF